MAVGSAVTFQRHLHLRERKKKLNNEKMKNSSFVSFAHLLWWMNYAMVAEQNNDYDNYDCHHLSQWGLLLFCFC